MPHITKELTVNAPIQAVWELVSDMERFSTCIPGCREVRRISETDFDWVLEAKVLRTTRKVTARTQATKMQPPNHAEFSGEGRLFERSNHYKLKLQGTTDLEDLGAGRTRVCFRGDVSANGVGGAIVDKVAAGQMDELFSDFEKNMREALGDRGGAADAPVSQATTAEAATRNYLRLLLPAGIVIAVVGVLVFAAL
ncbi:MAG: hypothetical protein A3H91_13515 [Gammaproteobacteria bacterium RIFCSPLOWO2_02_FULL_61_13]|nr:MAG: hypothetical protein A3H91_13515 [Gammaproteobacteria bacterium RIFCSPLOWO2_02_FULL_61_13]